MPLLASLRDLLHKSFLALPLLLAGFSLFMGLTQGNMGLLILFLGMATIVPFSTALFNLLWEFIFGASPLFSVPYSDVCQLILSAPHGNIPTLFVAPSYWMALMSFFFGYLITNASAIYGMKADASADPSKVENRKSQALTGIIVSSIVFAVLVLIRFFVTKCETPLGILSAFVVGGSLSFGWYQFAKFCNARDADIFGIAQGILPKNLEFAVPMTCLYKPSDVADSK
jgi:hypothetical protein